MKKIFGKPFPKIIQGCW